MPKLIATVINKGLLTDREAVVLKYLCEGYMRKEIARILFRSYGTISKKIDSIAAKLGANSTAEIIAIAVAAGLVDIQLSEDSLFPPGSLLIYPAVAGLKRRCA